MPREFARAGIQLTYPDNWTVETEETDEGWTASIVSPGSAFLMLSHYPDDYEPSDLADQALEAMRESYPQLEAEEVVETMAGFPVVGHDVDFFALDLTNTCLIRAMSSPEGTLLLMSQFTDSEVETNGEVMRAMCESIKFEDDE
jgi:hypothetical protein